MIEQCPDLPQCEATLARAVKEVSLIGELEYSPQDLAHLAQLVRAKINPDTHRGTLYLEQKAPTCLACLLVWIGTEHYAGNTYWPAVQKLTGLSGPNWQSQWGTIFLDVLHAHNLPRFDIEGSTTYVTPILGHGGIPNACLPEFFEQVLVPLAERDLSDPANTAEVIEELKLRREAEAERARIEAGLTNAVRKIEALQLHLQRHESLWVIQQDLQRLRDLETKAEIPIESTTLPMDYPAFRAGTESQLQELRRAVQLVQEQRHACESVIAAFSPLDRQVLAISGRIHQAQARQQAAEQATNSLTLVTNKQAEARSGLDRRAREVFDQNWQDDYGSILAALSLPELRQAIEHYARIETRCSKLVSAVVNSRNQTSGRRQPPRSRLTGLLAWVESILFGRGKTPRDFGDPAADLDNELTQAVAERERQRQTVARMLDSLPVRRTLLLNPNVILCEKLATLHTAYETWRTQEDERQGLMATQAQSRAEIIAVATAIGLEFADADRGVDQLESSLLAAGEHKRAAEEATAALDGDLSTQLAALTTKQSQLEDELSQVDQQLAALGDGSVEQGLLCVANARAAQAEANALRARLHQATRNMPDLGRRLRQPSGRDVMDTTVTELDAARQGLVQAQQEQRTWQAEREHVPGVWTGVDEPIRRFLLYGGHTAERFLVKAVTLYSSYHRDAAPQTIEIDLPPRVLDAFDEWYRQRANRDSPVSSERSFAVGGRAGNPFIYLDVENQAVMLQFPTQSLVELPKADRAWLEVTTDNRADRSERWPLRAYRGHDRILQTQELAVPLPTPAQAYRLHLISGEEGLRTWALSGFADRHCLVFDAVSGQLLLESEMAHGRVHAVLHRDFRLEPGSAVLDSFSLYGEWHEYVVNTVDLTSIDAMKIINLHDAQVSFSLSVSAEARGEFRLLGGVALQGMESHLRPVFTRPPEAIRTPIRTEAELRFWRLQIKKTSQLPVDSHSFRLNDLFGTGAVLLREGCFTIDLHHSSLLGARAAGEYTVRLRKLPHQEWTCEFVVLPGFDVHFEHPVYLPYPAGKAPAVRATITPPPTGTVSALRPARAIDVSPAQLVVELPQQESVLLMTVTLPQGNVPVSAVLPKVYWRLHGQGGILDDQWRDQGIQEEWWLDDWQGLSQLSLISQLPSSIGGRVHLSLTGDPAKRDYQVVRQSEARFDLLAFRDAIRAGPPLCELSLGFEGSSASLGSISLIRIRWQWEVSDVECIQESRGAETLLTISWQELGKTNGQNRLVRLWRAGDTADGPRAEVRVLEGHTQLQFQLHNHQAPPGNYFLQFQLEDPWRGRPASRPDRAGVNCHEIIIVKKDEIYENRLIEICAVRWLPSPRNFAPDPLLPGMYHIRIVGRIINRELPPVEDSEGVLVTRLNEGWYVGHLEVPPDQGLDDEMIAANPLKFEYDVVNREITSIEDKSGDGAMYCRECRMLFWSAEKIREEEGRHKRHLRGPIEHFDVEWL